MPRRGQGLQLNDRIPRAMRTSDMDVQDSDVFAMIKETMADDGLSQDPLLVMPGALLQESKKALNEANSYSCPLLKAKIEAERHGELQAIHRALSRDFPHMRRALAFYESMLRGDRTSQSVPRLTFLDRAPAQNRQPLPPELGARPQVPKPHELQECTEATENPEGRWFSFVASKNMLIILESKNVKAEKAEEPKKKKKKSTPGLTAKNFGSIMEVPKLKSAPSLLLAWRCRQLA
eukprot:Skav218573  [mRNA]  locus=scaffold2610:222769:230539:- [translate_table: standard]